MAAGRILKSVLKIKTQVPPWATASANACKLNIRGTQSTTVTPENRSTTTSHTEDARPFSEIPGPKMFPLIKNAWIFIPFLGGTSISKLHVLLQRLYNTYGKLVRIEIPTQPRSVWIFDPSDIETLYRNEGTWPIRMVFTSISHYRKNCRKDIFAENAGVFAEQGQAWHTQRSKLQQLLMRPASAMIYLPALQQIADEFIERMRSIIDPHSSELPGCIIPELYKWALESVGVVALDTRLGCLSPTHAPKSEIQEVIDGVTHILDSLEKLELGIKMWKYFPTPSWNKMTKHHDVLTNTVIKYTYEALEKVKKRPADSDEDLTLLEKILVKDPNPNTAVLMSLDMISGGIDTTALSVSYILYQLAKNPEKQEKLHQEIMSLLSSKDSSITPEIMAKLRYMKACVKETFRISPLFVWINRVAPEDLVIAGYKIPKDTMINMGWHTLMKQEKNFPEPLKYQPERWLKEAEHKIHPFSFLPFSYGPRMCLGRRFAELEMWILVTKIIQKFKVEYHYGDIDIHTKFINRPDRPLRFKLTERKTTQ